MEEIKVGLEEIKRFMNELDTSKNWIILSIKDSEYIIMYADFKAIPVTDAIGVYQIGLYSGIPVYKSSHIDFSLACLNGKKTYFKFDI